MNYLLTFIVFYDNMYMIYFSVFLKKDYSMSGDFDVILAKKIDSHKYHPMRVSAAFEQYNALVEKFADRWSFEEICTDVIVHSKFADELRIIALVRYLQTHLSADIGRTKAFSREEVQLADQYQGGDLCLGFELDENERLLTLMMALVSCFLDHTKKIERSTGFKSLTRMLASAIARTFVRICYAKGDGDLSWTASQIISSMDLVDGSALHLSSTSSQFEHILDEYRCRFYLSGVSLQAELRDYLACLLQNSAWYRWDIVIPKMEKTFEDFDGHLSIIPKDVRRYAEGVNELRGPICAGDRLSDDLRTRASCLADAYAKLYAWEGNEIPSDALSSAALKMFGDVETTFSIKIKAYLSGDNPVKKRIEAKEIRLQALLGEVG